MTTWRRHLVAVVVLCACTSGSRTVHADQPSADRSAAREFAEAQRAYEAGDYRRAAQGFEAAYQRKPHHDVLWNAARSWQRAGEDLRAANLLERYLLEAPADAPDRTEATAALASLDKLVGRLQLQVLNVTNVRVDGEAIALTSRYLAPGDHVATAEAGGREVRKVFSVGRGELVSVTLEAPATREPRGLSPWIIVAGGAIVAVGAAATIFSGLDTLKRRDAFLTDETAGKLDAGNAAQTRTNVLLGTTGGVALLTTVAALFFVDWQRSSPSPSRPTASTQATRAASSWKLDLSPFSVRFTGVLL